MQSMWRICLLLALGTSMTDAPLRYDLTAETSMPHLEENLRYTIERSQRCLGRDDLASAFPVLHHPSLAGCQLREQSHDENTFSYQLVCHRASGTTGQATWHVEEHLIRGTLDVKLGGKNMTFSQRVTGRAMGQCSSMGEGPV
ncbi:hypothetical protein GCM10011487_48340 [Steroidobacter agaridevorans]|uniref:DUF3617 family protein n=1 Tax=Steroidobacter agaridevorans TaxID=2695856 RepID=A0A829YHS7_9GAMM|nr:DUF3617 family protein [Steroidobacter agaridevorans]GFE82834.1 hypothetical protein GCM10011487_48340 [Steroidobacter agaridevorans]GFE85919.1 hypothetical protein GCM10011488_08730 [Steroidobacter agaridevorans]